MIAALTHALTEGHSPEPLLTAADLERIFRVGRRTLSRWIAAGQLPRPLLVGGVRRWPTAQIQQVLLELQPGALND